MLLFLALKIREGDLTLTHVRVSPEPPEKAHSPGNAGLLVQGDPGQTSDPQKSEIIHWCCPAPLVRRNLQQQPQKTNTWFIAKLGKIRVKCFCVFVLFKVTLGEERDLKNLKSLSTSKALGGVRLKSKDIELIFCHLHVKTHEKQ